jgi:hypothetical protein
MINSQIYKPFKPLIFEFRKFSPSHPPEVDYHSAKSPPQRDLNTCFFAKAQ